MIIRTLVKVYELETINLMNEEIRFRLEVFSNGATYTGLLRRHEFFRIQPTFPQKDGEPNPQLLCDEVLLVHDTELGGQIAALKESSEQELLAKVATVFAATFSEPDSEPDGNLEGA